MRGKAVLVVVFCVAMVSGIVASLVELDSPGIGRAVLARASEASQMALEASRFRFNLMRGLTVEDVRVSSAVHGQRYDLELARLRFEHGLRPLLQGRFAIVRVVAVSPRLRIRLGADQATEAQPSERWRQTASPANRDNARGGRDAIVGKRPGSSVVVELAVSELVVEDGGLWVRHERDGERLTLDGLDFTLREPHYDPNSVTLVHGLRGSGELRAAELRIASTRVADVRARVEADRGRFRFDELHFTNGARRVSGWLALDSNILPFRYEVSLGAGPLDVLPWAKNVTAQVDGRGFGLDPRHFTGGGTLAIPAGAFPDAGWVRLLGQATGNEGLVGTAFGPTRVAFELRDGAFRVQPFELRTSSTRLEVHGSIDLRGPIDLTFTIAEAAYRLGGDPDAPVMETTERRP